MAATPRGRAMDHRSGHCRGMLPRRCRRGGVRTRFNTTCSLLSRAEMAQAYLLSQRREASP